MSAITPAFIIERLNLGGIKAVVKSLEDVWAQQITGLVKGIVSSTYTTVYGDDLFLSGESEVNKDYVKHLTNCATSNGHPYFGYYTINNLQHITGQVMCCIYSWNGRYPVIGLLRGDNNYEVAVAALAETEKDLLHLDLSKRHFISRARERFGAHFSDLDYKTICNHVRSGSAVFLNRSCNGVGKSRYFLRYCGYEMVVGWDWLQDTAVTVMTLENFETEESAPLIHSYKNVIVLVPVVQNFVNKIIDMLDVGYDNMFKAREAHELKQQMRAAKRKA